MAKRANRQDHDSKVEIAKKIADQSKRVTSAYGNMEQGVFRIFRWFSGLVDKIIFTKRYLPIVSLLLAIFLYLTVNYDSENSIFANSLTSARTLSNVSVRAVYNTESFEVSGLPETCQVTVTGDAANVNNAITRTGYCQINLDGYTEGTHLVRLEATGYGDNVQTVTSPSDVLVTLSRKTTKQFEVGYDFINTDEMDSRYVLGEPVFPNGQSVNIRASRETLDSIAMVKALIDVSGQTASFETEAQLVAYDDSGRAVDAEIVPSTITVSVSVSSPHKTVPIVLEFTGEVPNDMAIDAVTMDRQTATIYASEEVLNTINQVTISYDASTLTGSTTVTAPVTLPEGVSGSDVSLVSLNITLAKRSSKVLEDVAINYRNNDNNYSATVLDNQTHVDVTVTGTANNIEAISANDIFVYIDLENLAPGTYDLPLEYELSTTNSLVSFSLNQLTLNITLTSSNSDSENSTEVIE